LWENFDGSIASRQNSSIDSSDFSPVKVLRYAVVAAIVVNAHDPASEPSLIKWRARFNLRIGYQATVYGQIF